MDTFYVIFCLENNKYLCSESHFHYTNSYQKADNFSSKEEAVDFLKENKDQIVKETGYSHFTTREYFVLQNTFTNREYHEIELKNSNDTDR